VRKAQHREQRQDQYVPEGAGRVVRARADQPDAEQRERSNAAKAGELEPALLGPQKQLIGTENGYG